MTDEARKAAWEAWEAAREAWNDAWEARREAEFVARVKLAGEQKAWEAWEAAREALQAFAGSAGRDR